MRVSIAAGTFGNIWIVMSIGMPLTMFMEAMGASGFLIGLLMTVRLMAMTAQIPGAFISDRLGSRKRFWGIVALIHRGVWFAIAGAALLWKPEAGWLPALIISLVALSDILANAATSSWLSWLADLIPAKNAGKFWGRRQSIGMAASLLGMAFAGYTLDLFRNPTTNTTSPGGFALVFGIAAVFGLADILIHLRVKEPRPAPKPTDTGIFQRLLKPLRSRDFRLLTLSLGAWSFGGTMFAAFALVYFKRSFPVTYTHVAAVTVAGSLGSVATSYLFGALIDRLGPRVLCAILMLLSPLPAAAWFFVHPGNLTFHLPWFGPWTLPQVAAVQVLAGFFSGSLFSGLAPCQLRLAAALSQASGRTISMAMHWSLVGLIAGAGALTGGWIMDWWVAQGFSLTLPNGTAVSYLHIIVVIFALLAWTAALPLALAIRAPLDQVAFSDAVSRMLLTNPVNAIRNFYNLQIISASSPAHERAEAARRLGVRKSEMAVPELAEQLDDPAMTVQEEAIEALGSIGTPDAVEALLKKLDDPACDAVPQICRALRHCGDARCVEPLLRRLQGNDRESLSECARTLGKIGDRRAIPHLLNLITQNRDSKVLAASSEALAALGELSAAYQIIPQMRAVPNRMLKRALAVAAGDLLGKREAFYQLLIAEMEEAGSGAGKVIQDLTRIVKKQFPLAIRQLETLELIETAYHEGEVKRCAELQLHLGLHLVQFIHRLPLTLDPNNAMQNLLERDRRAAIGVWYLKICNEQWGTDGADTRDLTDILLGLHIILSFTSPRPAAAALSSAVSGPA